MSAMTNEEAATLVKSTERKSYGVEAFPAFGASDVLGIVEIPMKNGAHLEIYVGKIERDRVRGTRGPGVTVFVFHRTGKRWERRQRSRMVAKSARKADLEAARKKLEAREAPYRPKPVSVAASRAKTRAAAITESKGAGKLTSVTLVGKKKPKKVSHDEVGAAEEKLGTRFPAGYRTFVTTLGQGILETLVRIHTPAHVIRNRKKWRAGIEQFWFWGEKPIAQAHALEGYQVADTANGDQLVVLPDDPDAIWILPRYTEKSRMIGRGLAAAVGTLVKTKKPRFEPY